MEWNTRYIVRSLRTRHKALYLFNETFSSALSLDFDLWGFSPTHWHPRTHTHTYTQMAVAVKCQNTTRPFKCHRNEKCPPPTMYPSSGGTNNIQCDRTDPRAHYLCDFFSFSGATHNVLQNVYANLKYRRTSINNIRKHLHASSYPLHVSC
jgi:hypothetical protein